MLREHASEELQAKRRWNKRAIVCSVGAVSVLAAASLLRGAEALGISRSMLVFLGLMAWVGLLLAVAVLDALWSGVSCFRYFGFRRRVDDPLVFYLSVLYVALPTAFLFWIIYVILRP
jgi:hypothetical protein